VHQAGISGMLIDAVSLASSWFFCFMFHRSSKSYLNIFPWVNVGAY
jgi:hypothetical protein